MRSPRGIAVHATALLAIIALWAFRPHILEAQLGANSNAGSSGRTRAPLPHAIPVPGAIAAERTSPLVIDGKLNDAAWAKATPVSDFTQNDPDEGKPATERTEVRFMFDNGALYVGAKM